MVTPAPGKAELDRAAWIVPDHFSAEALPGRCATSVIAANDSSPITKQLADYVCDGTADQVEIQAAIDRVSDGNQVLLAEGTFITDAPIYLSDDKLKLFGIGVDATEIYLADGSNCDIICGNEAVNKFFCSIEKMTLHGNNASNTVGNGINLNGSYPDFRLNDVYIRNCAYSGFKATGIWGYKITNNVIEWCGSAGDDYYGCYFHSGGESIISGCHVTSNYSNANLALFNISKTVVLGGEYSRGKKLGIYISLGNRNKVIGASFKDNQSVGFAGYLADILVSGDKHIIANNTFESPNNDYCIRVASGDDTIIHDNQLDSTVATTPIRDDTGTSKIHHNMGYVTENSGTATLVNGQTSIAVNHGLAVTPIAGDIIVVPIEAWGNMNTFYIDTYTATQFTIHSPINPGQDVDFAWKAIVL
jgi:hypothetical protein